MFKMAFYVEINTSMLYNVCREHFYKERTILMLNIHSFDPIINENSKVLVLGSIPGPESLRQRQYYANANNQFWKIIYAVFGETEIEAAYEEKVNFLLDHEIALWDVFHSADRKGALDADIKNEEPNDIHGLLQKYTGIKRVLLAGRKAELSFRKHFPDLTTNVSYVPSTSPAYAKKTLDDKITDWKEAVKGKQGDGSSAFQADEPSPCFPSNSG